MKLSNTTIRILLALANNDDLVVATLRSRADGDEWRACVAPTRQMDWFTVPIRTFHRMRRDHFLEHSLDWVVSRNAETNEATLIHTEYVLTDAGRAALAAEQNKGGGT